MAGSSHEDDRGAERRCYRLRLAYRGGGFSGWQSQEGQRTVEDTLKQALLRITGQPISVRGAGRTDAGVHARGQTASVRFTSRMAADKLLLALNAVLPADVAVQDADELPFGFDAKRHSVGKRYVYRLLVHRARDPFLEGLTWHHRGALDVDAMRTASRHLVGELDYQSFRAAGCQARHARRCLWRVAVEAEGPLVSLEVRGNAFCQHQVRIMAGTLVDVGRGRFTPDDVRSMVEAKDRTHAGQTAPAQGLTLEEVYYPDTAHRAGIPPDARWPGWPLAPGEWPPSADG